MFPAFHSRPGKKKQALEPRQAWSRLQDWYRGDLAKLLIKEEKTMLSQALSTLFGYFLVQSGSPVEDDLLAKSRIPTRVRLDFDGPETCPLTQVRGDMVQLPFITDSVDVVLLPHVLEFSTQPHQVLREVERILISEGHVVILGFNPYSLWGVWRLIFSWRQHAPWHGRFMSAARIRDWLNLLGFEVLQTRATFYRPPIKSQSVMNKLGLMESLGHRFWPAGGASYMLVARKKVETLTPIRPRWKTRQKIVAPGLAEP